ncbi:MAG: TetR family transcriptional regulator C-terminal domain-containing protein [Micrococcales bacterium]|nr:TetR family transcriptional regulator C-terminal domain-containing protein [Micrococcales bacterium]
MKTQVHMSAGDRREALIAAAVRAIRRNGMLESSTRTVAAEAGVSTGLMHHYFDSYDDLMAAAFERVAAEDLQRARAVVGGLDTPSEQLDAIVSEFQPARDAWQFQWWMDAWSSSARHPAVRDIAAKLNAGWQGLLEEILRAGVEAGEFDCPDPRASAWRLLALLDGLTIQVVAQTDGPGRADVEEWSHHMARVETGRG